MEGIFTCPEDQSGRVDKLLAEKYADFSRGFIKQCIEEGKIVNLDGSSIEPKKKIYPGDQLRVSLVRPKIDKLKPYKHKLSILFEDQHLLVIDKEAGMVVHPGDGTDGQTLVHALLHHCPKNLSPVGVPLRPGIVHRLDKETSGVMVVAKSESAHHSLVDQFANRETQKWYQAIVSGNLSGTGEFNQPIGRHPSVRVKMTVTDKGKPALTQWKVLDRYGKSYTHLECQILTGRTHQIRVHFSSSGHVLAGDKTYGFKEKKERDVIFKRVMLHARKLSFKHPASREQVSFMAPLPDDFANCLKQLNASMDAKKG